MRTQLFLDLQESGSAPEPPQPPAPEPPQPQAPAPARPAARNVAIDAAAPRRRPAVWQGPGAQQAGRDAALQRADAGSMQRAPDTAARGLGVAIESWADRAAQSRSAAPATPAMPKPGPASGAQTLPGRPARQDPLPPPPATAPAAAQARATARPDPQDPPQRPARQDPLPPPPAAAPTAAQARVAGRPDPQDLPQRQAPRDRALDTGPAAPPEPLADDVTIPRSPSTVDDADWLAARLRADAVLRDAPARVRFGKRRVVVWSLAGGLVAAVAAGGLWLYEDNRVDGALDIVARTAPAGRAPAAAGSGTQAYAAPQTVPAVRPAATTDIVRPVPDATAVAAVPNPPVSDTATAAAVPTPPVSDTAAASAVQAPPAAGAADRSVKTVDTTTARAADIEPPQRAAHQPVAAHKRPAPKTPHARAHDTPPAARAAAEPSPLQRREETLLQCRAHGYDERQCVRHACTMTRYGFVCRG
jgi:hypothetical protein